MTFDPKFSLSNCQVTYTTSESTLHPSGLTRRVGDPSSRLDRRSRSLPTALVELRRERAATDFVCSPLGKSILLDSSELFKIGERNGELFVEGCTNMEGLIGRVIIKIPLICIEVQVNFYGISKPFWDQFGASLIGRALTCSRLFVQMHLASFIDGGESYADPRAWLGKSVNIGSVKGLMAAEPHDRPQRRARQLSKSLGSEHARCIRTTRRSLRMITPSDHAI